MGKYKKSAIRVIIIFVCVNFMWSCSQWLVQVIETERTEPTCKKHEYSLEIIITGDSTYTEKEIKYIMNHDNFVVKSFQKNAIKKGSSFLCTVIPKNDQYWSQNQQDPKVTYFIRFPFSRFLSVSWKKPEKVPADKEDLQRLKCPINGDLSKSIAGEKSPVIKGSCKDNCRLIVTSRKVDFCINEALDTQIKGLMFVDLYGETIASAKFRVKGNSFHKILSAIKDVNDQSNNKILTSNYYINVEQSACNRLFTFKNNDIIYENNVDSTIIRLNPFKIGIKIPGSIDMKKLENKCPDFFFRMKKLGNDFIVEISEIPEKNDRGTFKLKCLDGELILRKERGKNINNLNIHFLLDRIATTSKPYNVVFKFYEKPFISQDKQQIHLPADLQPYGNKGSLLVLDKESMNYYLPFKKVCNSYDIESIGNFAKGYFYARDKNFKIVFDTHKEIESQAVIELHYFLRNRLKRILFVYYPLQYSTSYRSKIIDDNSEIAFKMDAGLRKFITDIHKKDIYDNIYIRFASDKTVSILQRGLTGINEFLFLDREIYDAPEYLWCDDLLENDYNHKNMHYTTAYIDILYFGTISSASRIVDKFKEMKNVRIYFINFIDRDRAGKIKKKKLAKLEILHHAPVALCLPTSLKKFGNAFRNAFNPDKIENFFQCNR